MMIDTAKKTYSKKKKAVLIILFSLLFLLVTGVCTGAVMLHNYCQTKEYTIVPANAQQSVNLIAHRGLSGVAPENTAPAYEEAGKAGYFGAECDVYRTKDGVWVLSHDSLTYRMMDKTAFVEKKTYDELLSMTVDNGVNADKYPDLKICSFEEYLEICVKYDMKAIIELKSKNNAEHYDEILALVRKHDAQAVFISFKLDNLKAMRKLTAEYPVWYIVKTIEEQSISDALALGGECGINFNGNNEKNTPEIVQKCLDKGLEVGAWTIDDRETMNRLLDMGVTYITTNCIIY